MPDNAAKRSGVCRPCRRLNRLLVIVYWLLLAAPAPAVNIRQLPPPRGYVNDFAHVIDTATAADIERYCRDLEQSTGVQMAVVTVDTLDGEPIEDAANALFRKWGIGQKRGQNRDEGVLLLLAINDRLSRLEIGRMAENYLPDGFDGTVLRAMRPSLRESKYGDALQVAVQTVGQRIAQSKNVQIQPAQRRNPPQQTGQSDGIPWLPIIGFIILLIFMSAINRRRGPPGSYRGGGGGIGFWPGVVIGNMMGGGGGRSSGGFGGYDSGGGGFGGFGGGDSGGGGASSNW